MQGTQSALKTTDVYIRTSHFAPRTSHCLSAEYSHGATVNVALTGN
jgi:hypothetical protein